MTDKKYYDQIDALKGIAIFLVVLGHSIIIYPINLHENALCNFIVKWLSSIHMPLFFIVSGFCFSFDGDYKTYIWKKVKRLLVPYLFFNAIDVVPRCLLSNLVNRPRGIGESLKQIIFYGGEYWFLYTLFLIFMLYPLIYKITKEKLYPSLLTVIIILGLHYYMPSVSLFTLSRVVDYVFFFMLGVIIKQYLGDRVFETAYNKCRTLVLIVILSMIWIVLIRAEVPDYSVAAALVGIFIFYLCMQFKTWIWVFWRFGKYSLQLYLLNGYLLVISRTTIVTVLGVTHPFLIIVFNMLIDFALSYIIIKYICERIRMAKMLMGMQ